jgi:hypothetical protein
MIVGDLLTDAPYTFVRRLSPTEIELAYGAGTAEEVHERWRRTSAPPVVKDGTLAYRYRGKLYRGIDQMRKFAIQYRVVDEPGIETMTVFAVSVTAAREYFYLDEAPAAVNGGLKIISVKRIDHPTEKG